MIVLPLIGSGSPVSIAVGSLLAVASMVPLALALAARVEEPLDRRFAYLAIGLCSTAAAAVSLGYVVDVAHRDLLGGLWIALTAAIPLVPGIVAAGPVGFKEFGTGRGPGGLLRSTELALAGATPLFALFAGGQLSLWPLVAWLIGIALAGRFTVRPLARLATRATLQRDLVVAASEAERARLAADIHDDALQELTLLVRRLEAAGDTEGAEIGRTVADKLRAICGDLRLPILDDLGVGPALDWLVLRIERLAGGEVRLERPMTLGTRRTWSSPSSALPRRRSRTPSSTAGRRSSFATGPTDGGISLSIDDAGPGIADDAPDAAEQTGRFGLLNMAQRAEQIGAILDVRRWPGGGTHVALEWRPH